MCVLKHNIITYTQHTHPESTQANTNTHFLCTRQSRGAIKQRGAIHMRAKNKLDIRALIQQRRRRRTESVCFRSAIKQDAHCPNLMRFVKECRHRRLFRNKVQSVFVCVCVLAAGRTFSKPEKTKPVISLETKLQWCENSFCPAGLN